MTAGTIRVYVRVEGEPVDPNDGAVPGTYSVLLFDDVPKDKIASAALDVFHSMRPISVLSAFEYTVYNEAGVKLEPHPDHVDYSMVNFGASAPSEVDERHLPESMIGPDGPRVPRI